MNPGLVFWFVLAPRNHCAPVQSGELPWWFVSVLLALVTMMAVLVCYPTTNDRSRRKNMEWRTRS